MLSHTHSISRGRYFIFPVCIYDHVEIMIKGADFSFNFGFKFWFMPDNYRYVKKYLTHNYGFDIDVLVIT